MKQINLPKKYDYVDGTSRPEYAKYNGWNKVSYSQWTSFKDYKAGYIQDYIMKVGSGESGMFAEYGSATGDWLNPYDDRTDGYPLLSDADYKILQPIKDAHPEIADFEYEILIDLEPFGLEKTCMQSFTDRQHKELDRLNVTDYKTLTMKTKEAFYISDEYSQLSVYGYGLEELGYVIGEMYVTALGRSGNTKEKGNKNVLRLSGEVKIIPKPYDRDKAKAVVQKIADDCVMISDYFKVYQKYFL